MSVLIVGSDHRNGESDADDVGLTGEAARVRSDTTMLMHIPVGYRRVEIVSIPRDTLVDTPKCNMRDRDEKILYTTEPQENARFSSAFAENEAGLSAGPAVSCTMRTVEKSTEHKVHTNDYMVINFTAFRNIVARFRGIPAYFEDDVGGKEVDLKAKTGCRLLDGDQTLTLTRTCKIFNDSSGPGRVSKQRGLVKTITNEAMDPDLFSDSVKLYRIAKDVMKNTDTNEEFGDVENFMSLAPSLQDVAPNDVKFFAVPSEHRGTYVVQHNKASKLWKNIADDKPVKMTADPAKGTVTDTDPSSQAPTSTGGSAENAAGENPASPETSQPAKLSPPSKKTPVCTRNSAK